MGDFSDTAGEWEMAPKCGSLQQDAGELVGRSACVSVSGACGRMTLVIGSDRLANLTRIVSKS